MIKKDFNKLSTEEQVEYINSKFDSTNTLTEICKQIGIARSTVSGRFKSKGYVLDEIENKFISKNIDEELNEKVAKKNLSESFELKELKELLPQIKKIIKWFENEKNYKIIIETDKFKGNAKNRTFMVYENVLNDYIKFCNKHKELKRQDMISQALLDFMNKYK